MIDIRSVSLYDLLPPNLQRDSATAAAAQSLDNELHELAAAIDALDIFGRSQEWSDEETDALASQYLPPYYDPNLPLEQRRALVRNAIPFHRRKGTAAAVEDLVALLFGYGSVEEWWQYGGAPYHFRVVTNNPDVTTTRAKEFIQAVNSVKRLSTVLQKVLLSQAETLSLYYGGYLHFGETITI
ncbi:phage tail protein I [Paenibacillus spiritus]|uniref:Phage tail protein I n=1 Tax=Paenibacillus spiritus TaxID=2496557 RepID=A0A5J5G957_9BACL|nr:phage tail protein I [Paenibacillus spiritus]KAA9003993.1 phage tail protein I [Paenibacillus spiritus]